ncbi:hypothetical protein QVD17_04497 [Tagetes erecta]|uniref:Uncharacterized protein n=1 Tax=Tagetes erecta TaxID=13708 RepID=A0AAD8LHY4_TARER|nr:hypothetical protein QVD17_04497 [Tagetes erecta]
MGDLRFQATQPQIGLVNFDSCPFDFEVFVVKKRPTRASKLLHANEFTLSKVWEETIKLIGKADYLCFSPEHPLLTESVLKALDLIGDED